MTDFEKLGLFYLGRAYDLAARRPKDDLLLYDSKDLVTHAVCVGMTGSGKTGLCLSLIEEAAIDGVPAIIIDPKGDISNLLLTFPGLSAEEFAPWVDEDEARRAEMTPEVYAAHEAERWRAGLMTWGQSGERIARLRSAADFAIYTPGSDAGLPVSILASFAAPPAGLIEDGELFRERIATTTTSLLGLLGIDADPIRSREHILLATILDGAWRRGEDLDLAALIQQIQAPPVTRVGVLDLETFYPAKDRFELAMALNNLLAAPGFGTWLEGDALDVGRLLHTADGRPRISIFSIAHLSDAQRMFFVSLLLNETLGWVRQQRGTTSLRAIVYMDEIAGYIPPVANPPSKAPLLTLLKQARAFGVGVVLATQNPVDLDYKGLSNIGTWFIGRLQTERDKARVLEGLEGVAMTTGMAFDRNRMSETLAALGNRVFLMNNVHDEGPEVFETRWAMSYLRGPLTRMEIKRLTRERTAAAPGATAAAAPSGVSESARAEGHGDAWDTQLPVLPPDVQQYFVPVRGSAAAGQALVYVPMAYGAGDVRFVDATLQLDVRRTVVRLTPITADAVAVDWGRGVSAAIDSSELEREPADGGARFLRLASAVKGKSIGPWQKAFATWLYGAQTLELLRLPMSKLVSGADETEGQFRVRVQQAVREQRDAAIDQQRRKYAPKIAAMQERLRRAEQTVERETQQASQQKTQTAIAFGTTLLGALLGRKAVSAGVLGRATSAARGVGRSMKESQDIARAQETVAATRAQMQDLETQLAAEAAAFGMPIDTATTPLEKVFVTARKTNIAVSFVALAWVPFWEDPAGTRTPAY